MEVRIANLLYQKVHRGQHVCGILENQYEVPSVHITCILQYVTKMSPYCFTCDETTVDVACYLLKVALVIGLNNIY